MKNQNNVRISVLAAAVLMAVALLCCQTTLADSGPEPSGFPLVINDVSGLDEPWGFIGGLPFPRGELRDASQIRIIDDEGREVPSQMDVVMEWYDGSIRWALAGFTANPQGSYRVEFGPGVTRKEVPRPLIVNEHQGRVVVDTGVAVYEFPADGLLPDTARLGDTVVLSGSGDGAYLLDNHGRLLRVAGAEAEITTEIVKAGPARTVVRREGWYVAEDGQRLARAKVWFYFSAGSPYVRISHTLIFTEDTNELWVRDYGLEFHVPEVAEQIMFAHRQADDIEKMPAVTGVIGWREIDDETRQQMGLILSGLKERQWEVFSTTPGDEEVYMLQDMFPLFLEREFRAVIGRGSPAYLNHSLAGFWVDSWGKAPEVAGDWGDATYPDFGMTVALPWLAQQFPKEIAFGPQTVRVGLWSGRSGRELDFRLPTLLQEHWGEWATERDRARRIGGIEGLLALPSNAQGSSRTHDVWLMPRLSKDDAAVVSARAMAASNPPLLLADPSWLTASEAIGWPTHPMDTERFAAEEAVISDFMERMFSNYVQLRNTGVIEWGRNHGIRGAASPFFRLGGLAEYNLSLYIWNLYARTGDRRFLEYATRFNQFAGNWGFSQWTAGDKYAGGFGYGTIALNHAPLYWRDFSVLFMHSSHPMSWGVNYWFTGDEMMMELLRLNAGAIRERWDGEDLWPHGPPSLNGLTFHYDVSRDAQLGEQVRNVVHGLINLDNPNGFEDESGNARFGALYKVDRNIMVLYNYYKATGDELARQAILKALDYKYRFFRVRAPFGGQNYVGPLFAVGYQWTGDRNYLRVVRQLLETAMEMEDVAASVQRHQTVTIGIPSAMMALAEVEDDLAPYPLAGFDEDLGHFPIRLPSENMVQDPAPILFTKPVGRAVHLNLFVRLAESVDQDADPEIVLRIGDAPVPFEVAVEKAFRSQYEGRLNLRDRHVRLTVPAQTPAGDYTLWLPDAVVAVVLDADADAVRLGKAVE